MSEQVRKYTKIAPTVMDGCPDAHNVFLRVANQRFCVTSGDHSCDTKEDAEWVREMLCFALAKIVVEMSEPLRAALQRIADEDVDPDLKGRTDILAGIAWAALTGGKE